MVVDDDHSGDVKVDVVTAEHPGALGQLGSDLNERQIDVALLVVAKIELLIDYGAYDLAPR